MEMLSMEIERIKPRAVYFASRPISSITSEISQKRDWKRSFFEAVDRAKNAYLEPVVACLFMAVRFGYYQDTEKSAT